MRVTTELGTLRGRDLLSVADLSAAEVEQVFGDGGERSRASSGRRGGTRAAARRAGRSRCCSRSRACGRGSRSRPAWPSSVGWRSTCPRTPSWAPARPSATSPTTSSASSTASSPGPVRTTSSLELAAQASIPVINGLTLREHPCQALADVFTIREHLGGLRRRASSRSSATATTSTTRWRCSARRSGMEVRLAHPAGLRAGRADRRQRPRSSPPRRGGRLVFGDDPFELVSGADDRLHRRLDLDGPGGRGGGATRRVRRVSRRRRADGRRRAGCGGDALPAGPPRRGDHLVGHGRAAEPDLRPVGEPAPRPEGAPRELLGDWARP